ncbi:MAG: AMP-dependent synthetase/ligase [Candidatus Scatovivens sp.]
MEEVLELGKNKIYNEDKVYDYKELIKKCVNKYRNKTAFTFKNKKMIVQTKSYIEYKEDVEALGTSFLNIGLANKKRIAIISPNRYEWCVSYLAITTSGNVVVPLDVGLPKLELESLIKRSKAEAVIFDIKFLDIIKEIYKKNDNLKYCICLDYEKDEDEIYSYNQIINNGKKLLSEGNNSYEKVKINKDDMSILLFTSGTTSNSKAVMLSQYNICSNITAMTTLIKARENDNVLMFLPLHHTLACTASFLFCFYTGFSIYFADSIKSIAKNMKEYEIRGLVCVPAVLELIYKKIIREMKRQHKYIAFKILSFITNLLYKFKIDIRRKVFKSIIDNLGGYLRVIIYGSASSNKKIIKFFGTIGIDMMQGYGLTESSPVIACESDKYHNKIKSTGYPLYNIELKIDNPNKEGIGEILVKGPNIMLGYYENEEATNKTLKDGWLYTGDLGYLDKKGQLYIAGRKKDVIVLKNGKNVYPEEVEKLINQSEYIEESFVYGKNTQDGDIKLFARLVYSKENELLKEKTKDEVYDIIKNEIKLINKTMPVYKYINEIEITTEPLIKTTTNKIKRHEEINKKL